MPSVFSCRFCGAVFKMAGRKASYERKKYPEQLREIAYYNGGPEESIAASESLLPNSIEPLSNIDDMEINSEETNLSRVERYPAAGNLISSIPDPIFNLTQLYHLF